MPANTTCTLKRAQYAEQLSHRWVTILKNVAESGVAGGPGTLTDEDLSDALQRVMAYQKAAEQWIKDLLGER